jgi:peptide deformylase
MESDILKIKIGPQQNKIFAQPKILPIIEERDPRLYEISQPITKVDLFFVECLKATLHDHKGLGLSAVQVGKLERIFVIRTDQGIYEYINPVILEKSDHIVSLEEGCISLPFLYLKVKRPDWVFLEWFDANMHRYEEKYYGLTARVIQHEIDHLEGITIKQRVSPLEYRLADQRRLKEKKKMIRELEAEKHQRAAM